ncbi:MAG: ABC transporter ATP-binding protein, partial [Gammaproteobacteria bacterium]|nr:ABC transporter ATP-binding protein [Gammaproteobacteria bacterium]
CDHVQIINKGELVLNESIEGLEHHMKSASLTVAFRHPPEQKALEKLPGVKSVQPEKDGRLHVFHEAERNPTDDILRMAVEKNWGLFEIRPGRLSLEQIFMELTTDAAAENAHASVMAITSDNPS